MNSSAAIPLSILLKCDFVDSYVLFRITLEVDFIKIGGQSNT